MTKPVLTAPLFDAAFAPRAARPEKLWGAPAIAKAIGVSTDTVQRLARLPDVPIYKPAGRYYAFRSELDAWLRTKPS